MAQYVMSMLRVSKIVPPKRQIIKDISLSFFPGAKIGLLGLNGAGKSTVLRIMAGADKEYDGEVQHLAGVKIGYLEQEPKLDAEKTGREEVESWGGRLVLVNVVAGHSTTRMIERAGRGTLRPDAGHAATQVPPRPNFTTVEETSRSTAGRRDS